VAASGAATAAKDTAKGNGRAAGKGRSNGRTPAEPKPDTLDAKIVEVRRRMGGGVARRGHNDHHDYAYQLAADVVAEVRRHLDDLNVALKPAIKGWDRKGELTTVELEYTLTDLDSLDSETFPWLGTGWDRNDKGLYKALTGGLKYFLVQLFQIGTNDDPEGDTSTDEATAGPRQAAPVIPKDRAEKIAERCQQLGVKGPVLKAKLTELGVSGLSQLNVDQAEDMEAWLENEDGGA
jgi:hypothetical protein